VQRDRRHAVEILDISRHGARVHGVGASRVGERVTLQVPGIGRTFSISGTVVWNDRARRRSAGIEFGVTCEEDARMLDGLLGEIYKAQPSANKGDVLVMMEDAAASSALEYAVRDAGFAPIARTTPAEVIKHLCREPRTALVAAFVSAELPPTIHENALAYLTEQWPAARQIVVDRDTACDASHVAAALRGAGRYG
jgi:hypothetical protein